MLKFIVLATISSKSELGRDIFSVILPISLVITLKMKNDRYDEYNEFIDQIYEIIQIYDTTDEIIIGGDMKTSPN
jgi:hypothetical protein